MNFLDKFPNASIKEITAGRNSRVFSVTTSGGEKYCAKEYFQSDTDQRPRMQIETDSLAMLAACGVTDIPRVLDIDTENQITIFSFIEGEKIDGEKITEANVIALANFLLSLQQQAIREHFGNFVDAADASFSREAIFDDIQSRFDRFKQIEVKDDITRDAVVFLNDTLNPFLQEQKGKVGYEQLPREYQILSPSDFGFHNILIDQTGGQHYIDFEYFGWDAPEKCINDFLLHPGFTLEKKKRLLFKKEMLCGLAHDSQLAQRVDDTYQLFGIKWCLILLNEFCPACWQRRVFVGAATSETLTHQLAKAKRLFGELRETN